MKKSFFITLLIFITLGLFLTEKTSADDALKQTGSGQVNVEASDESEIVDPEEPEEVIDPETNISTKGNLRFDHLPTIDFGTVKLTKNNRTFKALAEKVKDANRGSFIQISDLREKSTGWVIQVQQDYQFRTTDYDELTGAVLSLDKGWANSTSDSGAPTVTRNTLAITNIGEAYEVARAEKNSGQGIWTISFGSSGDNDDDQKSTITEEINSVEKSQKKLVSSTALKNSAVTLNIPEATQVLPKEYKTKFTWTITAAP